MVKYEWFNYKFQKMNKKIFSGLFALSFAGISLSAQESVVRSYDLKEVVVTATRMQLPLAAIPQKIEIVDKQKILSVPKENVADRIGSKNLLSINETGKKILDEQSYGSMMTNTGYSINRLTGGEIRPDITSHDYYAKGGYRPSDKILQHPAHLIFDYSAFCNLDTHARTGISIANLFDENYTEKDSYNMHGLSIMGHVSYLF